MTDWQDAAAQLDAADPLASFRDAFLIPENTDVVAYFDGNSLGRPLKRTAERLHEFVHDQWAGRLIRGWTDGWLTWPETIGDRLGAAALGAAPGQVVIADSTTVLLYKLARAAVDARPGRREVLIDRDNFPTDRYVLEGIAAESGLTLRWIESDPATGITAEQVRAAAGPNTALIVLSHVAYWSGWIADAVPIIDAAHEAGALVLWDLSHSAGSVDLRLDEWNADLAVGCGYKYLGGGPGAPAFAYIRRAHQGTVQQPIHGWFGREDAFEMAQGYRPAPGMGSTLSGTPPILAMVPLLAGLELIEQAGITAIREKSVQLTAFAFDLTDAWLVPLGARVMSTRNPERRGGHITVQRTGFRTLIDDLWKLGVIPDYRNPDAIRIGLSPLSTSFSEVWTGMQLIREAIIAADR